MAARDQQGEEGELRRGLFEEWGKQVGLEVVYRNRGDPPPPGEGSPHRGADEERADESGTSGIGDALHVGGPPAGLLECVADQGEHPADVVAGRDLGHDAAVLRVEVDLAVQPVRHEPEAPVVEGHPGLVARGFDAEHQHGTGRRRVTPQISPMFVARAPRCLW